MRIARLLAKFPKGSALLEAIIAIGVLLSGVVGSLVLVTTTIRLGRANQDRIVAQNLAREGIELVYSLRNSASLAQVEDQSIVWDEYLFQPILKLSNIAEYRSKYELGYLNGGQCDQRCDGTTTTDCTSADPGMTEAITPLAQECDIQTLIDYLFVSNPHAPPLCDGVGTDLPAFGDGTFGTPCDYNNSGGSEPTIGDVSVMIYEIFNASYHLTMGFPSIRLGTDLDGSFIFPAFIPSTDTYDPQTVVWGDDNAQVYEDAGTYVQGSATGSPTKFYRAMSVQAICRGNNSISGNVEEFVIPQTYVINCADYAEDVLSWISDDANAIQKVGGLVTSEVRWPTPDSSTKMKYQEFIYDWINA